MSYYDQIAAENLRAEPVSRWRRRLESLVVGIISLMLWALLLSPLARLFVSN